jgi:O-antigen/teichoic acid export membrane protein
MPHRKHRHTIIYAGIFSMVSITIGYCLRYISNLVIAEHLKAAAYGDFAFIISIVFFIGMILLFGKDEATLKFLSEYIASEQWEEASGFVKNSSSFIFRMCFLSFLLGSLGVVFLFISKMHSHPNVLGYDDYIVTLYLAPLMAILTMQTKVLRSYGSLFWSLITFNIFPLLLFTLGIIITVRFTGWFTLYHSYIIYVVAVLIVVIIQKVVLKKITPKNIITAVPKYLTREWNKVSHHLLMAELIFVGISSVDLIILRLLGNNLTSVGIFASTLTISGVIVLISIAINIGIAPLISVHFKKFYEDKKHLQNFANLCNILLIIPTIFLTAAIIIFGHQILHTFGAEFVTGYWALLIVVAGQAISVLLGTSFTLLRYTEHQKIIANINILTLILMIVLETILIPIYGYYGAAIGLAFSRIFMAIWFAIIVKKEFGIKPFFII